MSFWGTGLTQNTWDSAWHIRGVQQVFAELILKFLRLTLWPAMRVRGSSSSKFQTASQKS